MSEQSVQSGAKRLVVIGNSMVGNMISLLLHSRFDVCRIVDNDSVPVMFPFYSNDVSNGIMKRFLEDTGIKVDCAGKSMQYLYLYVDGESYKIRFSFDEFEQFMKSEFYEDQEKLDGFFTILKNVGQEWYEYIESRFNPKNIKFKESAKYFFLSLDDSLNMFGFYDERIKRIFKSLIPVKDVMFSVYAGYIYTQFFDVNAFAMDILGHIFSLGQKHSQCIQVSKLSEIEISKCNGSPEVENERLPADCVIDLRCLKDSDCENNKKGIIRGTISNAKTAFEDHCMYYFVLSEDMHVHVWNKRNLCLAGTDEWNFEAIVPCNDTGIYKDECLKIEKWLRDNVDDSISLNEQTYDPTYFKDKFDVQNGAGYCWAFNKAQSLNDPMNLVRKHKDSYLNCSQWGFAWFSAVYNIVNIISNQMLLENNKYCVKLSERQR